MQDGGTLSNSDDKRAESSARVRNLIDWCREFIKEHGKLIGKDPQQGKYQPRLTAHAFARLLVSVDLADHASMLPLGAYSTHQEIIGLLNRYIPILQQHEQRFSPPQDHQAPNAIQQPIAPPVVPTIANIESDRVGKAAMVREAAEWCKTEAGGIRASLKFADVPPQTCRNVSFSLVRMLFQVGQQELANKIDLASGIHDAPFRVIGLLTQTSAELERIASDLESAPKQLPPLPPATTTGAGPTPMIAEMQSEPDGPHPPNRLVFRGTEATLEPIPWRLIEYMWSRQQAAADDVCRHVWGESGERVGEGAVKVAQNKVNKALKSLGVPWRLRTKAGHLVKRAA